MRRKPILFRRGSRFAHLAGGAVLLALCGSAAVYRDELGIGRFLRRNLGNAAASFDGRDDTIEIPDSPSLRFTKGVALACWLYLETPGGCIVNKWKCGQEDCLLSVTKDGRVEFHLFLWGSPANNSVFTATRLPVDEWVHLTATYDTRAMRIYVNGALAAERKESRPIRSSDAPVRIGAIGRERLVPPVRGRIDDMAIFHRGLSAAETRELMAGKISEFKGGDGLVAFYDFDAMDAQVLHDRSGRNNYGRLGTSLGLDDAEPTRDAGR